MRSIILSMVILMGLPAPFVHAGETDLTRKRESLAVKAQQMAGPSKDVLCGCAFTEGTVNMDDCAAGEKLASRSSQQVVYVPIVTAAEYGRRRECWRKSPGSAISQCELTDSAFIQMQSDPLNLRAAIIPMASAKGHRRPAMLPKGTEVISGCGMKVSSEPGTPYQFEPADRSKGDVARVFLYFHDRYAIPFTVAELNQFKQWSAKDPVDAEERKYHDQVMALTKTCNPYILGKNENCW